MVSRADSLKQLQAIGDVRSWKNLYLSNESDSSVNINESLCCWKECRFIGRCIKKLTLTPAKELNTSAQNINTLIGIALQEKLHSPADFKTCKNAQRSFNRLVQEYNRDNQSTVAPVNFDFTQCANDDDENDDDSYVDVAAELQTEKHLEIGPLASPGSNKKSVVCCWLKNLAGVKLTPQQRELMLM